MFDKFCKSLSLNIRKHASALPTLCLVVFSYLMLNHKTPWFISNSVLLSGILAICFCGFRHRTVFLAVLGVFTCFERHFIIHYGAPFSEIGTQALITLCITDQDEIKAYLKIFKTTEYLMPLIFAAGCITEAVFRSPPLSEHFHLKKLRGKKEILSCAASVILLLASGAELVPPAVEHLKNWNHQKEFYKQRSAFKFDSRAKNKKGITTVLIIGESHRKDVFDRFVFEQDSYAPFLYNAMKSGLIWSFDDVITHYQQTYFSVFTLLCRRGADGHNVFWKEKGLAGLFQEAGFKTAYMTYQKKTPQQFGYNFVVNESEKYINHRESSGTKFDHGMLKILAELMPADQKNKLIILKMVGVHFHYATRYPKSRTLFKPCYTGSMQKNEYKLKDREKLINTYYNAMAYSADFLDKAAKQVDNHPEPAVLIFVSDHGIINFDDNKNAFFGAAKSNFHIPCFIYGNAAYRKQLPAEKIHAIRQNRTLPVTNSYLFDTIASLSGVDYPGKRSSMDLTSSLAKPVIDRKVYVVKQKVSYDKL